MKSPPAERTRRKSGTGTDPAATEATIRDCDLRLNRLLDAIETATLTPAEARTRVEQLRSERTHLEAQLPHPGREAHEIKEQVEQVLEALSNATPAEQAKLYARLGLRISYNPHTKKIRATFT